MTQPFPALQGLFGNKPKPYLMAHRGNRALCPENTLASFRQAIKDGADILETAFTLVRMKYLSVSMTARWMAPPTEWGRWQT